MDFEKVKGNFGFGCMRLAMKDGEVDLAVTSRMVDAFLAGGFNYFDTAHGYLDGKSETALRSCLTSRYPREDYVLTDKLSPNHFARQEDIRPMFERQLAACGVDYFDFYLMHAQNAARFAQYKACRAYETALELKAEGRIRHLGISFHDKAAVLDQILTKYPQVEVVQIQFNYLDYEDPEVESRKCYEVCRRHGKPVIIMEPVKGGRLAALPAAARQILAPLHGGSDASYAIRFAAGFEGVMMVLSGMGDMAMMEDNLSYMKEFRPLNGEERRAVEQVAAILRAQELLPCTGCRYCTERCPQQIAIPEILACLNARRRGESGIDYGARIGSGGRAADCVKCGLCEQICPQHLEIRALLETVAGEFEP